MASYTGHESITVDNTAGVLKQGMPVEAEIVLAPVS